MTHLTPEELETAAKGGAASAHLQGCAECRAQVVQAKGRLKLLRGMTPYTLGDDAFRRSEERIMAGIKESKSAFGGWRLWLPLGVAAAALLGLMVSRQGPSPVPQPPPQIVKQTVPKMVPRPEPKAPKNFTQLTVALASGAERKTADGWQALHAGDFFRGAAEVRAARLMLMGELTMLDGAPSRLLTDDVLAEADAEGAHLDLESKIKDRVMRVGPRFIKSNDAAYLATRAAASTDVEVRRGEVWVADDASFSRPVKMTAPARMHFADGAEGTPMEGTPAAAPAWRPRGAVKFDLEPKLPLGDRVSLDDQMLGGAPLSLYLPPGRHQLRFFQGDKLLGDRWVVAQDGAAALEEPKGQAPKVPVMAPEEQQRLLALAINAQKNQFSGCYEKWLKNNGTAGGSFSVAVVITERGKVKSASVHSPKLPEEVAECIKRTATGFKFPAVGEEVELEIPVQMLAQ